MNNRSGNNNSQILFGILAGVAAGALAGILLAPEKGSITRNNLVKRGRNTVDHLKCQVGDLVDKVS